MTGHRDDHVVTLETQLAKLQRINAALMGRVERSTDLQGNAFSVFETAIALEGKVRDRTADLQNALADLAASNAALGHARDLADQARTRLGDAIESIEEGFAIFDADDRLVLCNQTYLSFWPEIADRIVPGISFEDIAATIGQHGIAMGALVAPQRWISERVAQHRVANGGHVIALADGRWIQVNERRTSEGGIVGIYTDITDVKAADAQARARELAERTVVLQATLDTMPQGVCLFDRDRRLIAWNGPLLALLKLSGPDARARIADHQVFVDWCRQALPRADAADSIGWLADGEAERIVLRALADGRTLEVRRLAMPGGGMVLSFDDITERLAAATAMQESKAALEARVAARTAELREAKVVAEVANQSKTRFLAAASHDLLQPLNAARLFVSALAGRRLADANRTLVDQTASALDSIENLLEALLEISKLDAGAVQPDVKGVKLTELFAALKAEFAFAAERRGLTLLVPATSLWVQSDPRLLRRILQNYLSNALRYTSAGEVRMTATLADGQVVIAVRDSGPGIDPVHHQEIFEEFRRLDNGADRGMGLGLAIVQRASRMLGHPIGLESAPGRGSTFSVAVPAAAPAEVPVAATAKAQRSGLGARTVLVLDNEQTILDGMRALLEGWGCRVRTALTGGAALAHAAGGAVDIVLADYHLADGVTGDSVIADLEAALGRSLPAVVITADRTPELREALTAAGLHVLQKPVKPAQLRALLGRLAG